MDLKGRPAYQAEGCEACSKFKLGNCTACSKEIPQYASQSGSSHPVIIDTGFKSPVIEHWHLKTEDSQALYEAVSPPLCRECYFTAFTKVYPERKLKMDELPKAISYN